MSEKVPARVKQDEVETRPGEGLVTDTADEAAKAKNRLVSDAYETYKDTVAFVKVKNGSLFDKTSNSKEKQGLLPAKAEITDDDENTTAGTGFFVTADGVLATDYHVVQDAKDGITVTTANGVRHTATIKTFDASCDLALLQVEPAVEGEVFKPAKLALTSYTLAESDQVFTRGHTRRSVESLISKGTNNGRVPLNTFDISGLADQNTTRRVLTTTMTVDTGNSGGPLVRESDGAVVGIVDFNAATNRMAISTPIEDLHKLIAKSGIAAARVNVQAASPFLQSMGRVGRDDDSRKIDLVIPPIQGPQESKLSRYSKLITIPRPESRF